MHHMSLPLPKRNVTCPRYSRCLDDAVRRNLTTKQFDCSGCRHEHSHQQLTSYDCLRSIILLAAVFNEPLYQVMRRELVGLEV